MKEKLIKSFLLILSMMTVISCGSDDDSASGTVDNNSKEQKSIVALWQLTEIEDKGSWISVSSANLADSYIELCSDGSFNCYGEAFGWGRGNYKSNETTVWLYYGQTLSMTIQIQSHEKSSMQIIATSADDKTVTTARLKTVNKSQTLMDVDALRENLIGQWKLTDWGEEGNWKEINPIEYDYGYYALTFYEYGQVECTGLNTSLTTGYDLTNAQVNVLFRDGVTVSNVSDKYMTVTIDQQFGNYLQLRYTKQTSSEPVFDPTEIAAKRLSAFIDSLCTDVKYVYRETSRANFPNMPTFEQIISQTDYVFNHDGTGHKKVIELTTSWQGFLATEERFTWSITGDFPYNIKIVSENATSTTWNNIIIGLNELSGSGIVLNKERVFDASTISPEDIASYSVSNYYTLSYSSNDSPRGYYVSPCMLTLYYKDGKITRFPYANLNAHGVRVPTYMSGNGGYKLGNGKLYLIIGYGGDDELVWPMFSAEDEEIRKGHYYIPIGTYKAESDSFVPIENDVKFDFPI